MIKFGSIKSTDNSAKNIHGNTVYRVRDSLFCECLLSIIFGITFLSFCIVLKGYNPDISVNIYQQFIPLIMSVVLTIIRRIKTDKQFPSMIAGIVASVLFYLPVTMIPCLGFSGNDGNKLYLGVFLAENVLFSIIYRIRPKIAAADTEFLVLPIICHALLYFLFMISHKSELADNVVINMIVILVIYIVMRQIAVFNTRYYHTIRKTNRPLALLKQQNYKTVLGLIGAIAISFGVLLIFPISLITRALELILCKLLELFMAYVHFMERFDSKDAGGNQSTEEAIYDMTPYKENPWLNMLFKVIAVIVVIAIILLILNGIRLLLKNAPKYIKPETSGDDVLSDTIETIKPSKNRRANRSQNFGSGRERRVRKKFYDKTRRAMNKGLPVSDASTPGQIEKALLAEGDKDISRLKTEYEKVRYGK